MHPTSRTWIVSGLIIGQIALAAVFDHPVLLAGAVILAAWLVARAILFVTALLETLAGLTVDQQPAETELQTGATTTVHLRTTLQRPSNLALRVQAHLPTATKAEADLEVTVQPGERESNGSTVVTWPVAGAHRFGSATVNVHDGWFRQSLTHGSTPTVTVEPPVTRSVHVGQGGNRTPVSYGEHKFGKQQSGIEPASIREYEAGDDGSRIDWRVTARLPATYVREYEAETDRPTLLVVDHRGSLGDGPAGETKLDYLRQVALTIAGVARRNADPVGLATVDDAGISDLVEVGSTPGSITAIRQRLLTLEATDPTEAVERDASVTERDRRRLLTEVSQAEGAFARAFRPFLSTAVGHRRQVGSAPLSGTVRSMAAEMAAGSHVTLFTDDTRLDEVRDAIRVARTHDLTVTVFLAPTVLYTPLARRDLETAYEQYLTFEQHRRAFDRTDRVSALEVGPADRLSAVLSVNTDRGRRRESSAPIAQEDARV